MHYGFTIIWFEWFEIHQQILADRKMFLWILSVISLNTYNSFTIFADPSTIICYGVCWIDFRQTIILFSGLVIAYNVSLCQKQSFDKKSGDLLLLLHAGYRYIKNSPLMNQRNHTIDVQPIFVGLAVGKSWLWYTFL